MPYMIHELLFCSVFREGFENINEYLTFMQAQDIATHTLRNARSYSLVAEEIYKKTIREWVDDESFFDRIPEMRYHLLVLQFKV